MAPQHITPILLLLLVVLACRGGDGYVLPSQQRRRGSAAACRSSIPRQRHYGRTVGWTTQLSASVSSTTPTASSSSLSSSNGTDSRALNTPHHKQHRKNNNPRPSERGTSSSGGDAGGGTATNPSSSSYSSSSSTPSSSSSSSPDYYDFNARLNQLAEKASDPNHNPIAAAARAEEAWRNGMPVVGAINNHNQNHNEEHRTFSVLPGDAVSFNTILKAWRNCGQCLAEHEIQFDATDVSDLPIYTASDAAQHALQLLQEQQQQQQQQVQQRKVQTNDDDVSSSKEDIAPIPAAAAVDTTSFNIVMDAFVKSRSPHAVEQVTALFKELQSINTTTLQPDVVSWNALLDAHAYSDRDDRLVMLQRLIKQMRKSSVKPTVRTLNSVLHAYSRLTAPRTSTYQKVDEAQWEQYAQECEVIFQNMKETYQTTKNPADQPDCMTITNLITVHSRRRSLVATQRAEELFQELRDLYETTGKDRFQPSVYTYTVMILIWARTPVPYGPEKAQEWLQRLVDDPKVQPNAKSYTACIQGWARSSSPVRAAKALQLLQQMRASPTARPNILSYQAALEACCTNNAAPHQQTAALKIAFAVFRAAEQDASVKIGHGLYATLLKAVSVLLPPDSSGTERNDLATAVFRKACKAGQVHPSVVRSLQSAVSSTHLKTLLEPMIGDYGAIQYDKIPAAWSKHVSR